MTCERCGKHTTLNTTSYFNTDIICLACETEEQAHPDYQLAKNTEMAEVARGNLNYPGIGWPGKNGRVR